MIAREPVFSLCVSHTPWRPERVEALRRMLERLLTSAGGPKLASDGRFHLVDTDYRGADWQDAKVEWALEQWEWAAEQGRRGVTHHVFMTDDLHVMADPWVALKSIVYDAELVGAGVPIGLLSNHPKAPELFAEGHRGYLTNSWLVGPAYVLPAETLRRFLPWFKSKPAGREKGQRGYANDDSTLNDWITFHGPGKTWHPIPTIIEHRGDLDSTVGHGDEYSRERVSWRAIQRATKDDAGHIEWTREEHAKGFWDVMNEGKAATDAPMLPVGG